MSRHVNTPGGRIPADFSESTKTQVYKEQGGRCGKCGRISIVGQFHHIIEIHMVQKAFDPFFSYKLDKSVCDELKRMAKKIASPENCVFLCEKEDCHAQMHDGRERIYLDGKRYLSMMLLKPESFFVHRFNLKDKSVTPYKMLSI